MNRKMLIVFLSSAFACSAPKSPAPMAQPAPTPAPVRTPVAVATPQVDPLAPEVVVDRLHTLDAELIEASQLAEKSAHDRKVKKLAAHVLSARKKADAELIAMASKLSVTLTDANQLALPPNEKAALVASREAFASLGTKKGPEFDQSYLSSLDDALKGELGLLSQIDAKAASPELKAMSAKLAPVVTEHEKSASQDLKSMSHGKS